MHNYYFDYISNYLLLLWYTQLLGLLIYKFSFFYFNYFWLKTKIIISYADHCTWPLYACAGIPALHHGQLVYTLLFDSHAFLRWLPLHFHKLHLARKVFDTLSWFDLHSMGGQGRAREPPRVCKVRWVCAWTLTHIYTHTQSRANVLQCTYSFESVEWKLIHLVASLIHRLVTCKRPCNAFPFRPWNTAMLGEARTLPNVWIYVNTCVMCEYSHIHTMQVCRSCLITHNCQETV